MMMRLRKNFCQLVNIINNNNNLELNIPNNLNVKKDIIIEPIRIREKYDNLQNLMRRKETSVLINNKFEDSNTEFLIHDKQSKLISKLNNLDSIIFSIKFDDKIIKANVIDFMINPKNKFIHKIIFERYIEKKEKKFSIKVNSPFDTNDEFLKDKRVKRAYRKINVICNTEKIPRHIDIDLRILKVKKKILFRDIEQMLPHGIKINKEIHKNLNDHIIRIV